MSHTSFPSWALRQSLSLALKMFDRSAHSGTIMSSQMPSRLNCVNRSRPHLFLNPASRHFDLSILARCSSSLVASSSMSPYPHKCIRQKYQPTKSSIYTATTGWRNHQATSTPIKILTKSNYSTTSSPVASHKTLRTLCSIPHHSAVGVRVPDSLFLEQRIPSCRLYSQSQGSGEDRKTAESRPVGKGNPKLKEAVKELKKDIVFTIPNILTTMRMVLAPVIGYLVLNEYYAVSCLLFGVAGVSDVLDGWIARNFEGQTSAIGSFIDPLADKLLVSTLYVTLSMVSLIPATLTAMVITRDVCLIIAAFYVRYISLPPPKTLARYFEITMITAQLHPTMISKVNTAVQLSLVAASLAAPVFSFVDHPALQALWYLTAATTVASGLTYIFAKDTFKIIQQSRKKKL